VRWPPSPPVPLTPPRRRGVELLDDPAFDPGERRRSHDDIALANALFGGRRAVLAELAPCLREARGEVTLLDVGTGIGDIPQAAERLARSIGPGRSLRTIGLDGVEGLAMTGQHRTSASLCADARAIPLADRSVDFVTCSQVLHHFVDDDARRLIREMDRVARRRVIVADLRRSWLAAGGLWLASFPLGFRPVSRHDGVVSVLRGFTAAELRGLVSDAIGAPPLVRHRLGFRLTATWTPTAAAGRPPAGRPA
jgi:SAM-dependent methyltransferase